MPSLTEKAYTSNEKEVSGLLNKPVIIHITASCGSRFHPDWRFNRQKAPLSYKTNEELASALQGASESAVEEHAKVAAGDCAGLFVETRVLTGPPGPNEPFTLVHYIPAGTASINPT